MKVSIKQKLNNNLIATLGAPTASALLFGVLVLAGEVFRILPLSVGFEFWLTLPLLLYPVWIANYGGTWDWFLWTKTVTLMPVSMIWCYMVRFGYFTLSRTQWGTFVVLSTNIAEAVGKDLVLYATIKRNKRTSSNWNHLNAISGILLILAELPSMYTMHINPDEPHDFLWESGACWVLGKLHILYLYAMS
jgi:hypothetical protein